MSASEATGIRKTGREEGDKTKEELRKEVVNEYLEMENLFSKTLKWSESNHESLLFSNENHVVSFLSLDPKKMVDEMHPNLVDFLEENSIPIGESLKDFNARHEQL